MIDKSLQDYFDDFLAEIEIEQNYGAYQPEVFFEFYRTALIDSGTLTDAQMIRFNLGPSNNPIRVDGYEDDPFETNGILTLLVSDYTGLACRQIQTLNSAEMNSYFKRCERFITKSFSSEFRETLEENTDHSPYPLADLINRYWEDLSAVRIILLTDKKLAIRGKLEDSVIEGKKVIRDFFDFERYKNEVEADFRSYEPIKINLIADTGKPVPILKASSVDNGQYTSYIGIISGEQLANIYGRYQNRLLEQNVRVFLQATKRKRNVNMGIQRTLENQPSMFFAYNNGITCTADEVEINDNQLVSIKNLQIVNGAQTTASIYYAQRPTIGADLSQVFVQMKLSIISESVPDSEKARIIQAISEYSNSQNAVKAFDFFSNHPYQFALEKFSRDIRPPLRAGTTVQTKWYYERVRGQYKDDSKRNKEPLRFQKEYPATKAKSPSGRKQLINKSDVAKFINTWDQVPHIVSKNTDSEAYFAQKITRDAWEKQKNKYNEQYFKDLISKAIIFQDVDRLILKQNWYRPGTFKAQLTTYSIAKLAHDIQAGVFGENMAFDFGIIWQQQKMPDDLEICFEEVFEPVHDLLLNPPPGGSVNPGEWAKRKDLWDRVKEINIDWPGLIKNFLITTSQQQKIASDAVKDQKKFRSGYDAQVTVLKAGVQFWEDVNVWATENNQLRPSEISLIAKLFKNDLYLQDFDCQKLLACLERLQKKGCEKYIEDLD